MNLSAIQRQLEELRVKAVACLEQSEVEGLTESRQEELDRQYEDYMSEFDDLKARAEKAKRMEELTDTVERYAEDVGKPAGKPPVPDVTGAAPKEEKGVTRDDAFRALLRHTGPMDLLPAEVRAKLAESYVPADGETRAQSTAGSEGGFTIPEGFQAELVRVMLAYGPMLDPGVTREMMTDSGNPIDWPKSNDTGNTGRSTAEGTAIAEQAITFSDLAVGAYNIDSGLVLVNWQLLQDSGIPIVAEIASMLGERIGRRANEQLTTGATGDRITGIVTSSAEGHDDIDKNGGPSVANCYDLYHSVDPAYRSGPKVCWMMADGALAILRKISHGTGDARPLWQMGDISKGFSDMLLGKPVHLNQAMVGAPTANAVMMLFGDFDKYLVRKVRGIQMVTMTERYAERRRNGYLAWCRIDGVMLDDTAIKHAQCAA